MLESFSLPTPTDLRLEELVLHQDPGEQSHADPQPPQRREFPVEIWAEIIHLAADSSPAFSYRTKEPQDPPRAQLLRTLELFSRTWRDLAALERLSTVLVSEPQELQKIADEIESGRGGITGKVVRVIQAVRVSGGDEGEVRPWLGGLDIPITW